MIGSRTPEVLAAMWALALGGVVLVLWHIRHQDRLDAIDRPPACSYMDYPLHVSSRDGNCL